MKYNTNLKIPKVRNVIMETQSTHIPTLEEIEQKRK